VRLKFGTNSRIGLKLSHELRLEPVEPFELSANVEASEPSNSEVEATDKALRVAFSNRFQRLRSSPGSLIQRLCHCLTCVRASTVNKCLHGSSRNTFHDVGHVSISASLLRSKYLVAVTQKGLMASVISEHL